MRYIVSDVTTDEQQEIGASLAAHAELGPRYDAAVAEGLIERIGAEIDKRVDARLRGGPQPQPGPGPGPAAPPAFAPPPSAPGPAVYAAPPVPRQHGHGLAAVVLGLGSMGIGVGATAAVVSHHAAAGAQVLMVLLIWAAIAVINVAHSRQR